MISMITGIAALVFVLGYGVGFGWWFSGQIAQQSVGFGVVALIPAGGIGLLLGVVASVTASVGLRRISRSGGTGGRPFAEAGLATGAFALGLVFILAGLVVLGMGG